MEINAVEPRDQSGINGLQEEDTQATGKHNIWTKVNPDCCFYDALPASAADASIATAVASIVVFCCIEVIVLKFCLCLHLLYF